MFACKATKCLHKCPCLLFCVGFDDVLFLVQCEHVIHCSRTKACVCYAECRYADSVGIVLEPMKMDCAPHAERYVGSISKCYYYDFLALPDRLWYEYYL